MADVFTNDLRIREQEVGANSGAWGGYLNTSLENIAEAFSYGTEALADSATQTLTLADGASDELRSLYLKLTGTLSQATTVTIAPNTISKCWIIENATTGGYDVTISQGSGANVTVGNGNVKMIATDGAGAGGVVYDLLTDLELAGNVSITTTDNTSNLTLISTDADANIGPVLEMYRNSASPADNDELGRIYFYGENDNDEKIEYVLFKSNIVDASDGDEGSSLQIFTYSTGGQRNRIDLLEEETVFNEGQRDINFRVESDSNPNRFIIDAGLDKILIGNTTTRSLSGISSVLSVEGTGYNSSSLTLVANSADSNGAYVMVGKYRGSSVGSSTALQNGDQIGGLYFNAADGTDMNHAAAYVSARIYGDVSGNDIPGLLQFATTPDGSNSPTEKIAILPSGGITFNGDRSTANALDDYEEGTWTPVLIAGTTNPTGGGALSPYGSYTKVGNRVTVTFYVGRSWTNTPAGQIYVSGLPFVIENVNGNTTYTQASSYNINFGGGMTMVVPDRNAQTFNMYAVNNSADWTQINWTTHTTSPIYLSGQFSYTV